MQKSHFFLISKGGSALIFAMVFGIVFSIIAVTAMTVIGNGSSFVNQDIQIMRNYWAHESALNIATRHICIVATPSIIQLGDSAYAINDSIDNPMNVNGYSLHLNSEETASVYKFQVQDPVDQTVFERFTEISNVYADTTFLVPDPDGLQSRRMAWSSSANSWLDLLN